MRLHGHNFSKLKVYLITNRNALAHGMGFLQVIEEALRGGVRAVQLREKGLGSSELFRLAEEVRMVTAEYDALLFVNDRVDIARAVRADGVHLGQHSMPVDVVKSLVGHDLLVGVSTHTLAEVASAMDGGADFVTFGPVFFTPSKVGYGPPLGLGMLEEACKKARDMPVLALGGVNGDNLTDVMAAGAYGVAMISHIFSSKMPGVIAASILGKIERMWTLKEAIMGLARAFEAVEDKSKKSMGNVITLPNRRP